MPIVEFFIALLQAHAQTLARLAALIGEDRLVDMLGEHADRVAESLPAPRFRHEWFERRDEMERSPYAALEDSVGALGLPEQLEVCLWAYPYYRSMIEELELSFWIPGPGGDVGLTLVDEAVDQAEAWLKGLPIPRELFQQAQAAAHMPWLRFRTQVLKRIGKRPLGPVY